MVRKHDRIQPVESDQDKYQLFCSGNLVFEEEELGELHNRVTPCEDERVGHGQSPIHRFIAIALLKKACAKLGSFVQ